MNSFDVVPPYPSISKSVFHSELSCSSDLRYSLLREIPGNVSSRDNHITDQPLPMFLNGKNHFPVFNGGTRASNTCKVIGDKYLVLDPRHDLEVSHSLPVTRRKTLGGEGPLEAVLSSLFENDMFISAYIFLVR